MTLENEHNLSLEICISTIDDGIANLIGRLPQCPGLFYLVGHQRRAEFCSPSIAANWDAFAASRQDIRLMKLTSLGLSHSRNELIQASRGDILLFSDDDVSFVPGFRETIVRRHRQFPKAAVICFRFRGGGREKRLRSVTFRHNLLSAAKVSSIEISAKRSLLLESGCRFDPMFGLGSNSPSGEEYIFLTDCIKRRMMVIGVPDLIAEHLHESSGVAFYRTDTGIKAKGRMFRRVFGRALGVFFSIAFSLRKRNEYKHHISTYRVIRLMLSE